MDFVVDACTVAEAGAVQTLRCMERFEPSLDQSERLEKSTAVSSCPATSCSGTGCRRDLEISAQN